MPELGRGYKTTHVSSILCFSQIRAQADIQWCKIVIHNLVSSPPKFCLHARLNPRNYLPPAELDGIESWYCQVVGVWLQNDERYGCWNSSRIHNAYMQPTLIFAESNEKPQARLLNAFQAIILSRI